MKNSKKTQIINLFGASGSGKSTTAMGLTYFLRLGGHKVEYVNEYAKDLVYEESTHKLKHQLYVFAKQLKKQDVLLNKDLDYIITDSPILLSYFYGEKYNTNLVGFKELVMNSFTAQDNINFFIKRNVPFDPSLRLQDEAESDNDSKDLLNMLHTLNVDVTTVDSLVAVAAILGQVSFK